MHITYGLLYYLQMMVMTLTIPLVILAIRPFRNLFFRIVIRLTPLFARFWANLRFIMWAMSCIALIDSGWSLFDSKRVIETTYNVGLSLLPWQDTDIYNYSKDTKQIFQSFQLSPNQDPASETVDMSQPTQDILGRMTAYRLFKQYYVDERNFLLVLATFVVVLIFCSFYNALYQLFLIDAEERGWASQLVSSKSLREEQQSEGQQQSHFQQKRMILQIEQSKEEPDGQHFEEEKVQHYDKQLPAQKTLYQASIQKRSSYNSLDTLHVKNRNQGDLENIYQQLESSIDIFGLSKEQHYHSLRYGSPHLKVA